MRTPYSVLSCKLVTSFKTFQFSFFPLKMVSHYEVYVIFQGIEHQLQENILHHSLHYNSFKLRSIFDLFKFIYQKLLRHCPTMQIIYIPVFKIRWFYIFVIIFHIFVISFCILMNLMLFSIINSISISVNNSNFTSVFFKGACDLIQKLKENLDGLNDKRLSHFSKVFDQFPVAAKSNVQLLK